MCHDVVRILGFEVWKTPGIRAMCHGQDLD